ncbi:MAG TPA: hypothetical protein VES58_03575, partial [Syntrophobacteria bacterium]|nr:hypothetical protein [Syntrophobacteria bacterium]
MSTRTKTDLEGLREEIRQLCQKYAVGDIPERRFQPALAQATVNLYQATVEGLLPEGETIIHSHHVIFGHMRMVQSVMKEPEQQAVSLFLTERRLVRLRSTLSAYRQVTCDDRDDTVVDEVLLEAIHSLRMRRQIRGGEALVGVAVIGVALLFYSWLAITGPVLIALGALGVLHGLLLPTRWLEVEGRAGGGQEPICIYVLRKKSARTLASLLRERIP